MDGHPIAVATLEPRALRESSPPQRPSDALQEVRGTLLRRRGVVMAVFIAVIAVGLAATLLRPRLFEASAILMMSPREPEGVVTQQDTTFRPPDTGYVDSQVEILRSSAIAASLVDRLHLMRDSEWTIHGADRADVVSTVQRAIIPRRRGQTYVVEVGVRSRSAAKAALMSNTLVELYLASRSQARIESAARTSDWLSGRLTQLSAEVQEREAAVEAFRAQSGLLTAGGVPLTEQQIQEAETSALAAQVDVAERQARWRQAQQVGAAGGETLPSALTSDVMTGLRAKEADVDRRLAEYSGRYGDNHPLVIGARAEKDDVERQIAAEVSRLSAGLHNDADIARAREAALNAHLSSVRAELVRNNTQVVHLNELERQAASTRAVYTSFQQRFNELADGAAGVGGDAQLIAAAVAPNKPISRGLALMLGLVLAAGVLAGVFVALVRDKLSTLINTPQDVERALGLPVLSTIPELERRQFKRLPRAESHPGGFAVSRPRSAFAEAIRLLRTRVARAAAFGVAQTVAIASALPREGKTTTSLCLARVAAMSGKRVVLVDCDLRSGSLHVLLGIAPTRGILEVLRGEIGWRDVVGADDGSGAHIIPAAGDCFTPEDMFGSPAMRSLLAELAQCYDLVILDCPPVLTLAEARDLAALADATVLVARSGRTATHALRVAHAELAAAGANVVGVALNGVDVNAPGVSSYSDPLYFNRAQRGTYTVG